MPTIFLSLSCIFLLFNTLIGWACIWWGNIDKEEMKDDAYNNKKTRKEFGQRTTGMLVKLID
jgi:hypothetical protein